MPAKVFFILLSAAATVALPHVAFLPPAPCATAHDVRQCEVARPKTWADDDQRAVAEALERIGSGELGRGVIAGALRHGYRGLSRYTTDTRKHPANGDIAKFGPGFVLFTPKIIGITDAFFEMADLIDPISGYRVGDVVLLHELAHAYDDRKLSTRTDFTKLTGWRLQGERWEYENRVSISEYNGIFAETLTLYARGRVADAWSRDRRFATRLPFALPTSQSLAAPTETFADVLAHLILDPNATTYLNAEVVAWFKKEVFPDLTAPARF
jgi:hypothetical protein